VESPFGFDWDIGLDLGDMSGDVGLPRDPEGEEIVRQFAALRKHRREQIYDLSGNHDRSGLDEPPAWWWREWLDPSGEHTAFSHVDAAKRPFPVDGTWERYSFRVGNVLFLMMSDINEPTQKLGRGTLGYLHTSDYAPQGWFSKFDRVIKLSKRFNMSFLKGSE
jgi:hypothetical protein